MGKLKLEPFDDGSDFNQLADRLRRDVAAIVLRLQEDVLYSALSPTEQIECVLAGITTGLVGVCFAQVHDDGRGEVMKAIKAYLPHARAQVEGIMSPSRSAK